MESCDYHVTILAPPLSSTAAFVASIVVWHEKDRLHLSEPVDRVVLYFHVSVHNNNYYISYVYMYVRRPLPKTRS